MSGYDEEYENSTMQSGVDELGKYLVGKRIVSVTQEPQDSASWYQGSRVVFTLDSGDQVYLDDTDDCCAFTTVESLKFLEGVDNAITSVETQDNFNRWFIYAGDVPVVDIEASWSPGNPYYYGFGFVVHVKKGNA